MCGGMSLYRVIVLGDDVVGLDVGMLRKEEEVCAQQNAILGFLHDE